MGAAYRRWPIDCPTSKCKWSERLGSVVFENRSMGFLINNADTPGLLCDVIKVILHYFRKRWVPADFRVFFTIEKSNSFMAIFKGCSELSINTNHDKQLKR